MCTCSGVCLYIFKKMYSTIKVCTHVPKYARIHANARTHATSTGYVPVCVRTRTQDVYTHMYASRNVYMHVYTIHACVITHANFTCNIDVHIYTRTRVSTHTCTHALCTVVCRYTYACTRTMVVRTHINMWTCTPSALDFCTYMTIHARIYAYTRTHASRMLCLCSYVIPHTHEYTHTHTHVHATYNVNS